MILHRRMLLLTFLVSGCFAVETSTQKATTSANLKATTSTNGSKSTAMVPSTKVTTSLPTTTCGLNSSCYSTTEIMNMTTIKPQVNATTKTPILEKKEVMRDQKKYNGKDLCTCDLKRNYCDINCCCDRECSLNNKQIFTHCKEDANIYYDTRYCDYMKYIYINNTQFQWQVNQNGLFCVVKNNLPTSYIEQKKVPLKSIEEANVEKLGRFSWASNDDEVDLEKEVFNSTEKFVFGKPVWFIDGNNNIGKLKLPKSFITNTCIIQEKISLLKDIDNQCPQTDISEENYELSFKNYLKNISIIASPHLFNLSQYKNNAFQNCPRNVCLPLETKVCEPHFKNCISPRKNNASLNICCQFHVVKNTCLNVVTGVKYLFYHNGSEGLKRVEMLIILQNLTFSFGGGNFEITQLFSANFLWFNETKNYSSMLSGNPGYLLGKPILLAKLVNVGNSSNVILKLQRNFLDYRSNFLVLPENVDGFCVLNHNQYLPIEFGYNLITKCKFQTILNGLKSLNSSKICENLQKSLLKLWSFDVHAGHKTIGMYGNANVDDLNDWIGVLYEKTPKILLNETFGNYTNKNKTLTCFGISTKLYVDVFYSRVDFENLLNQNKILGVVFKFGGFRNFSFAHEKNKSDALEFSTVVGSQVMFYDITKAKKKKFVEAPNFKITLPHDFFYPFIKIENNGSNNCSGLSLFLTVLLFVVYLII